jgi:uncharacterized lipoprotein YajG
MGLRISSRTELEVRVKVQQLRAWVEIQQLRAQVEIQQPKELEVLLIAIHY